MTPGKQGASIRWIPKEACYVPPAQAGNHIQASTHSSPFHLCIQLPQAPHGSLTSTWQELAGGLFMDEGGRTNGSGSVSEMTQPILEELWTTAFLIWLLRCLILSVYFPFVRAFLWTMRGLLVYSNKHFFRVKKVFNHQPIFLSSFPRVCPCLTFAESGASGRTFLCCRAAVRQGWRLLSFSPHKACCGQRLIPMESIQPL